MQVWLCPGRVETSRGCLPFFGLAVGALSFHYAAMKERSSTLCSSHAVKKKFTNGKYVTFYDGIGSVKTDLLLRAAGGSSSSLKETLFLL
jgi:hypothetical protein